MREPKINKAHYTTLLKDISNNYRNAIRNILKEFDEFIQDLDNAENLEVQFVDMFFYKYNYYEINDKDENLFCNCIEDVFYTHFNYYSQLAAAYYKKFDFTTANKRIVHREDSGSSSTSGSSSSSGNSENDTYGLPNKQVNTLKDGYLTNVEKSSDSNESSSERSGETSLESEVVTTYSDEYLDLKRQFIRQLRDLCGEFIDKFNECFLHVYS